MGRFYDETYLAHYGVPHQKWGNCRWQYPDGSLTPAGQARRVIFNE